MEKFIYYQIEGYLPSSFVSIKLGNIVKFADRKMAIEILEDVLNKWKVDRNGESFNCNGELVNECIYDDNIMHSYRHQFVFKQKRTGLYYELSFRVVQHTITYYK